MLALDSASAWSGSDHRGRAAVAVAVPSIQAHLSRLSELHRNGVASPA